MGRRTVFTDDLDDTDLGTDAQPVRFSVGRTSYEIYLSEDNHGKFLDVLDPYIKAGSQVVSAPTAPGRKASDSNSAEKRERNAAVRKWAQSKKFKDANGKVPGDRGRIAQEVYDGFYEAHTDLKPLD